MDSVYQQIAKSSSNKNNVVQILQDWEQIKLFKFPLGESPYCFRIGITDEWGLSVSFFAGASSCNFEASLVDLVTGKLSDNKEWGYDNRNGGLKFFSSIDELKDELLKLHKLVSSQ